MQPDRRSPTLWLDLSDPGEAEALREMLATETGSTVVEEPEEADLHLWRDPGRRGIWLVARTATALPDRDAGPVSALLTDIAPSDLVDALRLIRNGYRIEPPGSPSEDGGSEGAAEHEPRPSLTDREQAVLALLADGSSNKAIARRLGISASTTKFHVAAVLRKLGARSRLDAVAIGIRLGLVLI